MEDVPKRKFASIYFNELFIIINTHSGYRSGVMDVEGKELVLPVAAASSELGEALKQSLECSRTLKIEEIAAFFDYKVVVENFHSWPDRMMLATGKKTKTKFFKTLKHCGVCLEEPEIKITPTKHIRSTLYEDIKDALVTVSSDSSSVELGEAMRRAFALCE